jgi:hypothetical protein
MSRPPHKKSHWAKVPRDVLLLAAQRAAGEGGDDDDDHDDDDDDERAAAAATVEEFPDEGLWRIRCVFGDAVYGVLHAWVAGLDASAAGPFVSAAFSPRHAFGAEQRGRCARPARPGSTFSARRRRLPITTPASRRHARVRKVAAVVVVVVLLQTRSPPSLPAPLASVPAFVNVPNAKAALDALLRRIQSLDDPVRYPTISNLPRGSYICDMAISWANAGQDTVALFRAAE